MSEKNESVNGRNTINPEKRIFDQSRNIFIALGVSENSIDLHKLALIAERNGFEKKSEFHITVLGNKNGNLIKKILEKLPADKRTEILAEIKSLVDNTDWSFIFEDKKYHVSKEYSDSNEKRESYIQMVDLPGMKIFYGKLNAILGTNLEIPPAHITLYTKGDKPSSKIGIGINSEKEFIQMNPREIQ